MAPPSPEETSVKTEIVGLLGSLNTFDSKTSNFSVFSARLTQFFIANGITDSNRKRAILLNTLSEDCYVLVRSLCVPDPPESKSIEELIKILNEHFSPVKSFFAERLKFYNCKRTSGESVAEWQAKVKSLASNCGFGNELSVVMRDIFVIGVNDDKIMDRLFEEDVSKASFEKVVKLALSKESAIRDHELRGSLGASVKPEPVYFQKQQSPKFQLPHNSREGSSSGRGQFSGTIQQGLGGGKNNNFQAPRSPRSPRSPSSYNNACSSPKSPTIFKFGPQSPNDEVDDHDRDHFAMDTASIKNSNMSRNHYKARNANENKPLDSDSQTVSTSMCSTTTTGLSSRHSSLKEKRGRRQLPSPNDSTNSTPTEKPKIHRCRKSTSDLTDMTDNGTTTTALSRSGSRKGSKGNLAYLASRRGSRGSRESISSVLSNTSNEGLGPLNFQHPRNRQRRTSNFLELPVPDHVRPRVCSLPEKTINPRLSDDLYRLRTFSITNKGVVNYGDSIINRRSRSNTSVNSITSRSNVSGERSPFDGSCCGSGYHSVGSDSFDSLNEIEVPKYRVITLGDAGVGKTALVSQFMTSEYMNTYDASLDDEFGERTVSVLLDGQESEMVFIDHPASEMSVENSLSTYEPHACIVVYSVTTRSTFQTAEEILNYLWNEGYTKDKSVIVVGNKADLARSRVITQFDGKSLAVAKDCKFIETSSGIQHNVDELLVGILKQIRLRESLEKKKSMTKKEKSKMKGSKTSLRLHFAKEILQKICLNDISKSKSCENLHVL